MDVRQGGGDWIWVREPRKAPGVSGVPCIPINSDGSIAVGDVKNSGNAERNGWYWGWTSL